MQNIIDWQNPFDIAVGVDSDTTQICEILAFLKLIVEGCPVLQILTALFVYGEDFVFEGFEDYFGVLSSADLDGVNEPLLLVIAGQADVH